MMWTEAEQVIPPQPKWLMEISRETWFEYGVPVALGLAVYAFCGWFFVMTTFDNPETRLTPRQKSLLGISWPLAAPCYGLYRLTKALLLNR